MSLGLPRACIRAPKTSVKPHLSGLVAPYDIENLAALRGAWEPCVNASSRNCAPLAAAAGPEPGSGITPSLRKRPVGQPVMCAISPRMYPPNPQNGSRRSAANYPAATASPHRYRGVVLSGECLAPFSMIAVANCPAHCAISL